MMHQQAHRCIHHAAINDMVRGLIAVIDDISRADEVVHD